MRVERAGFVHSTAPEPHRQRTKEILKAHPEIRQLMGKNPYTFGLILAVVGLQVTLAALLQGQPWWLVLVLAYVVGAVATHALAMMIHECAHNLLFKRKNWNFLAGIVANLPMVVPSAIFFKRYHLKHHAFQGSYALDGDIASAWEARLIGHSSVRKTLWMLFLPFFQMIRIWRLQEIKIWDGWLWLNIAAMIGADVAVFLYLGPVAFFYLVASLFFAVGLHPVGARWIQEHYLVDAPQETYSYYGPLNRVAINVGYHNEHHDFPSVPWHRLPQVRHMASEWYDSLAYHTSWTKLLIRFIVDPNLSLYSRMVRTNRGDVAFTDEFTPDLDAAQNVPSA